jgi:patched 1 protein
MLKQPNMQPYDFYTFSTMLLNDLLSQYDFMNPKLIYIGCIIMVSY